MHGCIRPHALYTGMRNVAASGNKIFKTRSFESEDAWHSVEVWRKHRCVLFLTRYYRESGNYNCFYKFVPIHMSS